MQYSNFHADLYSTADYLLLLDSDVFFITPITPEDLFIDGKPRIFGYNGCCPKHDFTTSLHEVIGGEIAGEFMLGHTFPFIIKREHFQEMRSHIIKRMKVDNFEKAFKKMCTKYKYYCQFDIMVHYVWNHHRDEYSWHINDANTANYAYLPHRMTNNTKVLEKNDPVVYLAKQRKSFIFESK